MEELREAEWPEDESRNPVVQSLQDTWGEVFFVLLDHNDEIHRLVSGLEGDEQICRIIWAIAAWDLRVPLGGSGGSLFYAGFSSAQAIKDAVERLLAGTGGMSDELGEQLKMLNQLLCMRRCV